MGESNILRVNGGELFLVDSPTSQSDQSLLQVKCCDIEAHSKQARCHVCLQFFIYFSIMLIILIVYQQETFRNTSK